MTYAKNWAEIAERANEFIEFLQGDNFFSEPFNTDKDYFVITNAQLGMKYACEGSCEEFTEWESVYDAQFLESFEWELNVRISHFLITKTNFFNFFAKNLNGLLEKWKTIDGVSVAEELMMIHFDYIFNCYANDYFPPMWQEILNIYLSGGLPCGWSGHYPVGKMVVFSNY